MKTIKLAAFAVVLAGMSVPAHAGLTFFTNRGAWEAAVGTFQTENFNSVVVGRLLPGTTNVGLLSFAHPGPQALGSLPEVSASAPVNGTRAITSAVGIDGNTMFGNLPEYNDYILPGASTAFGANWESASSAGQLVLSIPVEGAFSLPSHLPYPGTGFFGFISDTPFTTLRVTGSSTSIANPGEIYSIDNISFDGVAVVPEPGAYLVLATGLGIILGRRRVRSIIFRK